MRHHHETRDGAGYPDGLHGAAIPLGTRIFAIADTFDAMTSDRPYRAGLAPATAVAEIAAQAGRQFDPAVVAAFLALAEAGCWPGLPAPPRRTGRGGADGSGRDGGRGVGAAAPPAARDRRGAPRHPTAPAPRRRLVTLWAVLCTGLNDPIPPPIRAVLAGDDDVWTSPVPPEPRGELVR